MTVLTGEGTTEIIYGTTSVPAGAMTYGGYLARPDRDGEWPTVLVFGPEPTPTSAIKGVCRRLARHGIAALAPDMTQSHSTNRRVAMSVAGFVTNRSGGWSNARFGYGAVAFGPGIHDAAELASSDGRALAVASIGSTLADGVSDDLSVADIPVLFVGSRGDDTVDVDLSLDAQGGLPQTSYALYSDAEAHWWDIEAPGYDEEKALDTISRVVAFFSEQLPARI